MQSPNSEYGLPYLAKSRHFIIALPQQRILLLSQYELNLMKNFSITNEVWSVGMQVCLNAFTDILC